MQPVVDTLLKELEKRGMALSMGNINPHGMLRSIPGSTRYGLPSTAADQDETDDDALALNRGHKRRRQNDFFGTEENFMGAMGRLRPPKTGLRSEEQKEALAFVLGEA